MRVEGAATSAHKFNRSWDIALAVPPQGIVLDASFEKPLSPPAVSIAVTAK